MGTLTSGHPGHEDILELVCPYHGIRVQVARAGHKPRQHIVGNIIERLFLLFIGVHVERITDFRNENPASTCLDRVDW